MPVDGADLLTPGAHDAHGAHIRNPDKLAAEADKLLQSAFEYGPLQDDTVMVDAISNNSDSE